MTPQYFGCHFVKNRPVKFLGLTGLFFLHLPEIKKLKHS